MSLVTTPFGFSSTAREVLQGVDLSGRRMIVTGGSSGIGIETARALVEAGAEVTLAVRRVYAGERVAADIRATTGSDLVHVEELELSQPASVAAFAARWDGPLDVLVNNAGVMAAPLQYTPEGVELHFATNHLGHFALANALHEALAKSGDARIVSVSSTAHLMSPVVFDDIQFRQRPYDGWMAYAQSKTANVLFAVEATKRWAADGITVNALNPGAIATRLLRYVGTPLTRDPRFWKSPEQGAATSVLVAGSPLLDGVGGRYFHNVNEAPVIRDLQVEGRGVANYAVDPDLAHQLWEESLRLLG